MASTMSCISCQEVVTKRMHAVCCDDCGLWQHRKCKTGSFSGVTAEKYRQWRHRTLVLEWRCVPCRQQMMSDEQDIMTSPVRRILNATYTVRTDITDDDSDEAVVPVPDTPTECSPCDAASRDFDLRPVDLGDLDLDLRLDDTILEKQPLTFQVVEGGSKRGGLKLVSSDGYTYTRRKQQGGRVYWACSVRGNYFKCYARVTQRGDQFTQGFEGHMHFPDPGALKKVTIAAKVKQIARENVSRSAGDIVKSVMKEMTTPDDFMLPNPANLIRAANRHRQLRRENSDSARGNSDSACVNRDSACGNSDSARENSSSAGDNSDNPRENSDSAV